MKRGIIFFLFAVLSFPALAHAGVSENEKAASLRAYNVVLEAQNQASKLTNQDPAALEYIRQEGACAYPVYLQAEGEGAWDAYGVVDISLGVSTSATMKRFPTFVSNTLGRIYRASYANPSKFMRRALHYHAARIRAWGKLPSGSACSLIAQWESDGFVGLNELTNKTYGDMVFQNAWLPVYKNFVFLYEMQKGLVKRIGKKRTKMFIRNIFWHTENVWERAGR